MFLIFLIKLLIVSINVFSIPIVEMPSAIKPAKANQRFLIKRRVVVMGTVLLLVMGSYSVCKWKNGVRHS